jgi:two-component system sensor histidine kinase CiaH
METMVLNLIENAVKYSPESSIIQIMAEQHSDEVVLQIQNDGDIPADDQKLVFQKFFRGGNEETRTAKGTGVGLFLVRELAELHKGSVAVQAGDGTVTFTLKLPK